MSQFTKLLSLLCLLLSACNHSVVTTEYWPDGTSKRQATVQSGDTVRIEVFDEKGRITKVSNWKLGMRHGTWEAFYPDGKQWSIHHYEEGVQVGQYQTWHPNGKPFILGQYDSLGAPAGTWQFFDEKGQLIEEKAGVSIHNSK